MEQLGTPMWWRELEAVLGILDPHKFAWKICVSFYVPEVQSRTSLGQEYSTPLAPRSLNRGAFLPGELEYQDVRQRLALLTIAYCRCLQYWAEKCNLPRSPDCCPLAKSVRELSQVVQEFINITKRDILEGLEMEEPEDGYWPPSAAIFSQVLEPPVCRVEMMLTAGKTSQPTRILKPRGRAHPFFQVIPFRLPARLAKIPSPPTSPPMRALMVLQLSSLSQGFAGEVACLEMPEPTQTRWGHIHGHYVCKDANHLWDLQHEFEQGHQG